MLSDKTIRREKPDTILRRAVMSIRRRVSVKSREKLNAKIQKKLKNADFTIFSNNCLGGVIYHDAGKQFTSPLINTALDGEDFIRFLENPKHYLNCEMQFYTCEGHPYPIAKIDDIEVRFVHYKTEEEAREKWAKRTERIDWSKLLIIATNHDGLSRPDLLERFDRLPYEHKLMFVSQEYPQYDWAFTVPFFKGRFQVRPMTNLANIKGERYYEICFDMCDWILKNT